MVKDKSNKNKIGNWENNDIFALKISHSDPNYNGKYLILIYTIINKEEWAEPRTKKLCRAKIVPSIPNDLKELNDYEYIKTGWNGYLSEKFKFPKEVGNILPDDFQYIYIYVFEMWIRTYKVPNELIYLGNYKLEVPKNEYIPISRFHGIPLIFSEKIQDNLIYYYDNFNLRKCESFNEASKETIIARELDEIEFYKYLKKLGDAIDGPNGKEVLKSLGIDPDKKIKNNSITYVGNNPQNKK